MGAFTRKSAITIENQPGWEPGEYIRIKGAMTVGDSEMVAKTEFRKDGQMSVSSSQVSLLECMIEDWHLLGDGNQPVPFKLPDGQKNRRAIAKLPMEYAAPVLQAIDASNLQETRAEQDAFFNSANGHLPIS